jgi:hypothetical protein
MVYGVWCMVYGVWWCRVEQHTRRLVDPCKMLRLCRLEDLLDGRGLLHGDAIPDLEEAHALCGPRRLVGARAVGDLE